MLLDVYYPFLLTHTHTHTHTHTILSFQKLLTTMLPTAEEKEKIQEAAITNPELPLGSAEQFLMMLASISELPARLNLWIFKLDYENTEKVREVDGKWMKGGCKVDERWILG